MNLKIGQKVRIKPFKYPNGPRHWVPDMFRYSGKVVTISSISHKTVHIEEDKDIGWRWSWTLSDFELTDTTFLPDELFEI